MKKVLSVLVVSILLTTGISCAGWLHRAYQGEFYAHDRKYVVSNDGTLSVQEKHPYMPLGGGGVCASSPPGWQTMIAFSSLDDLDNVIGDLKRLSAETHKAYGEGTGCVDGCK